jgi:hypothetical protein
MRKLPRLVREYPHSGAGTPLFGGAPAHGLFPAPFDKLRERSNLRALSLSKRPTPS